MSQRSPPEGPRQIPEDRLCGGLHNEAKDETITNVPAKCLRHDVARLIGLDDLEITIKPSLTLPSLAWRKSVLGRIMRRNQC